VRVYATSGASRRELATAARLDEQEIGLLPIPVDTDVFKPALDRVWSEAAARPVLTFLGRADDPRKNVSLLFEAFAHIRSSFPTARLRLIGRPPRLPLPAGVEAVGEVEDPAAELRRAGLFVLTSRQEGFGIVVAEALACGLPVVTTPSGGPESIVHNSEAGIVTEAADAEQLAMAVRLLVEQPERLREMRRKGREFVEREHSVMRFRNGLRDALTQADES
jgi:glycosyltransferase involved in cell wall biosynthesis